MKSDKNIKQYFQIDWVQYQKYRKLADRVLDTLNKHWSIKGYSDHITEETYYKLTREFREAIVPAKITYYDNVTIRSKIIGLRWRPDYIKKMTRYGIILKEEEYF